MAFRNAGKPLVVENSVNNPKIFALVASTRVFSIAKSAMGLAVLGYPIIALALTRFLSEIVQSTQYLVRHPGMIDYYFSGGLPLARILKFAKEEASTDPGIFGPFWGLQSRFSHATPDFLSLTLKIDNNKMSNSLVIQDLDSTTKCNKILAERSIGVSMWTTQLRHGQHASLVTLFSLLFLLEIQLLLSSKFSFLLLFPL